MTIRGVSVTFAGDGTVIPHIEEDDPMAAAAAKTKTAKKGEPEILILDVGAISRQLAEMAALPSQSPRQAAKGLGSTPKAAMVLRNKPDEENYGAFIALNPDPRAGRLLRLTSNGRDMLFKAHAPGLVVEGDAIRSPSAEEYINMLVPGAASLEQSQFTHGYMQFWVDPSLAGMCGAAPALIEQLNVELAKIGAKLHGLTPVQVIHNTHGDVLSRDNKVLNQFQHYTLDEHGNKTRVVFAGLGWAAQAEIEGVYIPGAIGLTPDGTFVGSPWCQRAGLGGGVKDRQFNHLENHYSLLEWLAGPATSKFLATSKKTKLVAAGSAKVERELDPALKELHAGFAAVVNVTAAVNKDWAVPDAEFKKKLVAAASDGTQVYVYHYQLANRWLMPVSAKGVMQPKRAVPAFSNKPGYLEDFKDLKLQTKVEQAVMMLTDPVVDAYYAYCSAVLNGLRGGKMEAEEDEAEAKVEAKK